MNCPEGILVPDALRFVNYHRLYGITARAKGQYDKLDVKPDVCIERGECEDRCPSGQGSTIDLRLFWAIDLAVELSIAPAAPLAPVDFPI